MSSFYFPCPALKDTRQPISVRRLWIPLSRQDDANAPNAKLRFVLYATAPMTNAATPSSSLRTTILLVTPDLVE